MFLFSFLYHLSSEGTTNDYPVKAMFDYNNNNINKVYNGGLKDEIKNTFGGQERASQGSMTLIGEITQTTGKMYLII